MTDLSPLTLPRDEREPFYPWEPPPDYGFDDEAPAAEPDKTNEVVPDRIVRPFTRIPIDLRAEPLPVVVVADWLYDGLLTVLQSEPGVGKSFIAAWMAQQVMETGRDVIYLDEEGGPELITERLRLLGADPDVVAERLHYFAFESRQWKLPDMMAFDEMLATVATPGLGVLDSLPDFLAAADLSEDSATDVTRFIVTVCGRLRSAGCAQLVLDHLKKPEDAATKKTRSRYSRGSGAKLAKADATLLLEAVQEFDANRSGRLKLWKTKDRRGRLPLPALDKDGLAIEAAVSEGSIRFAVAETAEWHGPTQCMDAVETMMRSTPGTQFSKRGIGDKMRDLKQSFRDTVVREAVERLALDGRISAGPGRGGLEVFWYSAGDQSIEAALPDADEWDGT